jgi:hypothetical protein
MQMIFNKDLNHGNCYSFRMISGAYYFDSPPLPTSTAVASGITVGRMAAYFAGVAKKVKLMRCRWLSTRLNP